MSPACPDRANRTRLRFFSPSRGKGRRPRSGARVRLGRAVVFAHRHRAAFLILAIASAPRQELPRAVIIRVDSLEFAGGARDAPFALACRRRLLVDGRAVVALPASILLDL